MRMRDIATYASNGAGVAANDLDGDGDLDLVFASVDRESAILWNQGGLKFTEEPLDDRFTRGVNIVDVDGDGRLDITFTHRGLRSVSYWRNSDSGGQGAAFAPGDLPGVSAPAYSMGWADLNQDGALDLVTGSYNVDLRQNGMDLVELENHAGVYYYENQAGVFLPHRLALDAETLSVGLLDLDGDGRLDVWVANDFALPDGVWLNNPTGWQHAEPFRRTSHSAMSIEWGDLDNRGELAVYTTDMNPGTVSTEVLAIWLPVLSTLEEKHGSNDPQIMANVLQVRDQTGQWRNEAPQRGIDATGWTWAARFGDLDNDGYLDLYITNGMIASNLFRFLANYELVEPNLVYRNNGQGRFELMPGWGLASTASGRGMIMADFDFDGDLDIVINNLRSRAQLFENRLCAGDSLQVDLRWPSSMNRYAIGAQLELHTSMGVFRRDVRASGGYLSGDPSRIHFGFPPGTTLEKLIIVYPDGATAEVTGLTPHTLIEVVR